MKITRAHHPFEGKTLAVVGSRRCQGRLHLIVVIADGSRLMIPAEWTDLSGYTMRHRQDAVLGSMEDLRRSRVVVDALQRRCASNVGKTANLAVESACANQAELPGRHTDLATDSVGSTGGGTKDRGR